MMSIRYYSRIFAEPRDEFSRSEITQIRNAINTEFQLLLQESGGTFSLVPFLVAVILTGLWTLMGGIIGEPHYTSEAGNYFFYSCLIQIFTITFHRGIYEYVLEKLSHGMETGILSMFFKPFKMILLGVSLSLASANLAVYGTYHEIFFPFVFCNLIAIYFLLVINLNDKYPSRLVYPFLQQKYQEQEDWNLQNEEDEFKI